MMDNRPDDHIVRSVRAVEAQRREQLPVPPASAMLRLVREQTSELAPSRRLTGRSAAWLAWNIGVAQLRIVHPAVLPSILALLLAESAFMALNHFPGGATDRLHGAFLLACIAAVSVLATPGDVRREYLSVTPVGPSLVLAARLATLLGSTLLFAALSSVVLATTGSIAATPLRAIVSWLGPAFLTAGLVTWVGVWRGATPASGVGVLTLALLIPAALGRAAVLTPLPAALLGLVFFALALRLAGRPTEDPEKNLAVA